MTFWKLIDSQKTLVMQYMFAVFLIVSLFALLVYAMIYGDLRSLWVAAGLSAMVLLLLAKEKGASLFLAVMLVGTLVAREEFILDAAAVIRGENIQDVRESRIGAPSYGNQEVSIAGIQKEIEIVLSRSDVANPQELASEIIGAAQKARIDTDKGSLNDSAKAVLHMLAEEGPTGGGGDKERWEKYVNNKGLNSVAGSQQLKDLGYVVVGKDSCGRLTERGEKLAETLGFKPVNQSSSCSTESVLF